MQFYEPYESSILQLRNITTLRCAEMAHIASALAIVFLSFLSYIRIQKHNY